MPHGTLHGAQDKGLQLPNGFANEGEDIIDAFKTVKAAMERVNKEHAEAASKPIYKQVCTTKNNRCARHWG